MEKKSNRKKPASRIVYWLLLGVFCLIFIGSAIYLGNYLFHSIEAGNEYSDLQDMYVPPSRPPITEPTEGTGPVESTEPTEPIPPEDREILPELQVFYEQNNHLVGWINVPGTRINYPVVQQPIGSASQYESHLKRCYFKEGWSTSDYYLKHTFSGSCSDWGAIYVRESCNVFTPSDNITIYGHHMKDGSMFSGLDGYKKQSFWETHQYIYFDTLYERHVYQVIVAFKTSANYGEGYAYHLFDDAASEEEFNKFIADVKALAYYDTGISAQYGDKLITLSTCEYTLDNGRHVVIAKRIG